MSGQTARRLIRTVLNEWKARGWRDIENTAMSMADLLEAGQPPRIAAKAAPTIFLTQNNADREQLVKALEAVATGTNSRSAATVVILTALDIEYSAVRKEIANPRPEKTESGTRFEVGTVAGNHLDWKVALAQIGSGNIGAAIEATAAIEHFVPDLILFVGIAGSLKSSLSQGSVVVAKRIYLHDSGRADADGWKARPIGFPTSHRLSQLTATLARDSDGISFESRVAPIVAGEALVGSSLSAVASKISVHFNDAVAVDMESAGLYMAAHRGETLALAVRGISDGLDDKTDLNDSKQQPLAARNAATFTKLLLRSIDLGMIRRNTR
jgi:adenosylhomocysteine nucleosidase